MTTQQIPTTVAKRKRLILSTDIAIAVVILSAALHFVAPGASNLMWMFGGMAAAAGTVALRNSINGADLPETELDEYELKRHAEAREDGLRSSLAISMALFVIAGAVAFATRFWAEVDGYQVAIFFAKVIYCQLIWVPFSVARSLAGKINRDELISGE